MTTGQQGKLTLYFSHVSYYSHKALLALHERAIPFTHHIVDLDGAELFQPKFLDLNPKGEIPMLMVDNKAIVDSEAITSYVAELPSGPPLLLGDTKSATGQTILRFRKLLDSVNVPVLTYGTFQHPQLASDTMIVPGYKQKYMRSRAATKLNRLAALSAKYPDYKDVYRALSQSAVERGDAITDLERVEREVEVVSRVLDSAEAQYSSVKEKGVDGKEVWLCGVDFSAADIMLTILLARLCDIGQHSLFKNDEHPHLQQYYEQAIRRPSFLKLLSQRPSFFRMGIEHVLGVVSESLPLYIGGLVALGGAVGLGCWLYNNQ